MDGYTFMIERNQRLIQHEVRMSQERAEARSGGSATPLEEELRRDVLELYNGLEGCGRAKILKNAKAG